MKYITSINDHEFTVEIIDDNHVVVDDQAFEIDFHPVSDQPVYSLLLNGKSIEAYVYSMDNSWQVLLYGNQYAAQVEEERERRLRAATGGGITTGADFHLKSPMPGLVVSVVVEEGQRVRAGELLIILESMKMQNELKSPRDGMISRIRVQPGESVEQRQTLLSVV